MKFCMICMIAGCLVVMQMLGVAPKPVQAVGPLRAWLLGRQSNGSERGDGYGDMFNNLTCDKLVRLVHRRGGEAAGAGAISPTYTVSYGPSKAQAFNLYAPKKGTPGGAPAPIILMVHGGAWCVGDMNMDRVTTNKINRWVPKGFIFISVNYRMLPDKADVMTQAGDVASAIGFVQAHAAQWNGNPSEIIVMGHSAGAHLVSLLGSDPSLAAKYGAKPWLGTISLDSAAMDVQAIMQAGHPAFYDDAFGRDPADWTAASPLHHLSRTALPWLGVCSTKRKDSCPQAYAYSEKAAKSGVKASVLPEDLKHGEINEQLGQSRGYTEAVESFMGSLNQDVQDHLK
jgi:arylformamidase